MRHHLLFYLSEGSSLEKARAELEELGIADVYVLEDILTHKVQLGGWGQKPRDEDCQHVLFDQFAQQDIDWEAQWTAFSPAYREGAVHLPLSENNNLLLKPGAGFGDYSHPTTRLAISLMKEHAPGHFVIDIGCGSGILSLASIQLGARFAYGIDIEEGAIAHSSSNAALNQLTTQTRFSKDLDLVETSSLLILMNMISSEQISAWSSHPSLHNLEAVIITSGIPISGRTSYLALTESWGWRLLKEEEQEGWLGFCFEQRFLDRLHQI